MSSITVRRTATSQPGEPAWEIATLFPTQGHWTEAEYFALETSRFVALSDGCFEVLPRLTWRNDYAKAGVEEYWIVDPAERCITVLVLTGDEYGTHGEFRGGNATSRMLTGFADSADQVFAFMDMQDE